MKLCLVSGFANKIDIRLSLRPAFSEMETPNFEIGQVIVIYNSSLWFSPTFYKIVSFTKTGMPRIAELPNSRELKYETAGSVHYTIKPDTEYPVDGASTLLLRKTKHGFRLDASRYFSEIYDPNKSYVDDTYY